MTIKTAQIEVKSLDHKTEPVHQIELTGTSTSEGEKNPGFMISGLEANYRPTVLAAIYGVLDNLFASMNNPSKTQEFTNARYQFTLK